MLLCSRAQKVSVLGCLLLCVSSVGLIVTSSKSTKLSDPKHPDAAKFLNTGVWKRLWIVTGGQSGVDRAAMERALELHLPLRGWCPLNRTAEDGRISEIFPLQETSAVDPALRTELNAIDSDGTLLLTVGNPTDGTPLTVEVAKLHNRPILEIKLDSFTEADIERFRSWIDQHQIKILNIAGPRESYRPGFVHRSAYEIIGKLLRN